MDKFYIEFSKPAYFPGDLVQGNVIVSFKKPIKPKNVTLKVLGKAEFEWPCKQIHAGPPGSGNRIPFTSPQRRASSSEIYYDYTFVLWDADGFKDPEKLLYPGLNKLPFSFNLPSNCSPSLGEKLGCIRYFCVAKISSQGMFMGDKETEKTFFEIKTNNRFLIVEGMNTNEKVKKVGSGYLSVHAATCKKYYYPKETMAILLNFTNNTHKKVNQIIISFLGITSYKGMCKEPGHKDEPLGLDHIAKISKRRVIESIDERVTVGPGLDFKREMSLAVPEVIPTFSSQSQIIQVSYALEVKVILNAWFNNELVLELPVVVIYDENWSRTRHSSKESEKTVPITDEPPSCHDSL